MRRSAAGYGGAGSILLHGLPWNIKIEKLPDGPFQRKLGGRRPVNRPTIVDCGLSRELEIYSECVARCDGSVFQQRGPKVDVRDPSHSELVKEGWRTIASAKSRGSCKVIPGDTEISPQGYCAAWAKKA